MKQVIKDKLTIEIYDTREQMGRAAAKRVSDKIIEILKNQEQVSIIFASAPSQNDFLAELVNEPIEWDRVVAFHMDEYIGLDNDAPQSFARFLKEKLFAKVPIKKVHYMDGATGNAEEECERYAKLIEENPVDIVILGIGENGHLAFNDPHVADFNDPLEVKVVDLDQPNRLQQVNDGAFKTIDEVPTHAITLTMPALFKARYAYAMVPTAAKATAIYNTANSAISEKNPSTLLRKHPAAILYTDVNGASKLEY